jgi:hypothetical protein
MLTVYARILVKLSCIIPATNRDTFHFIQALAISVGQGGGIESITDMQLDGVPRIPIIEKYNNRQTDNKEQQENDKICFFRIFQKF